MVAGPLELTLRVVRTLEGLGIPYVLGGSLASSLVGEPRATADIDLAIRIGPDQVAALVRALSRDFYISEEAVEDAVRRGTSFNVVHLESVTKVDMFVLGDDVLDRRQLERRVRVLVNEDPPQQLWIGSAEDQVLRKLAWYRAGGQVSDRQWRDVIGILAVQSGRLDLEELRTAAEELGLSDLVERAIAEAEADGD